MCSRLGILTVSIYKAVSLSAQFVSYKMARYHTLKKRDKKLQSRKSKAAAAYDDIKFDKKTEKRKKNASQMKERCLCVNHVFQRHVSHTRVFFLIKEYWRPNKPFCVRSPL